MSTTLFHHILSLVVKELEPHSKNSLWILTNLPKPMLMQNITGNMELKYLLNMDLDLNTIPIMMTEPQKIMETTPTIPHMNKEPYPIMEANPHKEATILKSNPQVPKGSPKFKPKHLGCMR